MLPGSIYTNKLSIGYEKHIVRKELTFALQAGELVCLIGANGCGKSTLLRTLAGLQPPIEGSFVAENLAIVLTERVSMDNTTVHDIVALGRYPYTSFMGTLKPEDEQAIETAMEQVGLNTLRRDGKPYKQVFFNALSDGEKQRVLIAKALAQQTPVILLDEPTAHLDIPNRIQVLRLLRDLAHQQGKTILLSTHELDLALQLSDRILLMTQEGIELDSPTVLKEKGAFEKAFGMDVLTLLKC